MTTLPTSQDVTRTAVRVNRRESRRFADYRGPMSFPLLPGESEQEARIRRFEEQYEFHKGISEVQRQMRAEKRSGKPSKSDLDDDVLQRMIDAASGIREAVIYRVRVGAEFPAGFVGGNPRYRHGNITVDHHLRSENDPIVKFIISNLPRRVMAGETKDSLTIWSRPGKTLGGDCPYVEVNKLMRRMIRVDIDGTFPSWEALIAAIVALGVPEPNIGVAYQNPITGAVVNPHIIFCLETAVCFTENGRRGPQELYHATAKALTHALAGIGADIGGLSNICRIKNPACPKWSTFTPCKTLYTLRELTAGLPEGLRIPTKDRQAETIAGILADDSSNKLFRVLRLQARQCIGSYRPDDDQAGFRREVEEYALSIADQCGSSRRQVDATVKSVVNWTWNFYRKTYRNKTGRNRVENAIHIAKNRKLTSIEKLFLARSVLTDAGIEQPTGDRVPGRGVRAGDRLGHRRRWLPGFTQRRWPTARQDYRSTA